MPAQEQPNIEARLINLLDSSLAVTVFCIGHSSGIFNLLQRIGSATLQELAKASGFHEDYLADWCRAACAFGQLQVIEKRLRVSPTLQEIVESGALLQLANFLAVVAQDYIDCMKSGAHPGYEILKKYPRIAEDFGRMLEEIQQGTFFGEILPEVQAYREITQRGGKILDLGCGNGWILIALVRFFPGITGVGIDFLEENIESCKKKVEELGLATRLSFFQEDMLSFEGEFDMITLHQSLHYVWDRKGEFFRKAREALRPGGFLAIWQPAPVPEGESLYEPMGRLLCALSLWGRFCGTRLPETREVVQELEDTDFFTKVRIVGGGTGIVIVGKKKGVL